MSGTASRVSKRVCWCSWFGGLESGSELGEEGEEGLEAGEELEGGGDEEFGFVSNELG